MDTWDLYFITVVGWKLHPGYPDDVDLEKCADIADKMMEVRRWRIGEP